ncbi:phage late control D family protein, partial [Pseudomonas inefficax]
MTGLDQLAAFITDTREGLQRDSAYGVPAFRLSVDGKDIARLISPRLMSLELTDNRGLEADQLSITLSDHDGLLEIPPKGAVVRLWLGWSDSGLVDKGTYT